MRGYERLVEVAGLPAAETLCRHRAGRGVYIPQGDRGEIVRLIGIGPTRAMRRAFGTGTYTVPLGPMSALSRARRQAQALLRAGAPAGEAAHQAGLSPRTVRNLRRP